jgi:hypothetical protein
VFFLYISDKNSGLPSSSNYTVINSASQVERGQPNVVVESSGFFQWVMFWPGSIVADPSIAVIPTCKVLSLLVLLNCGSLIFSYLVSVAPSADPGLVSRPWNFREHI